MKAFAGSLNTAQAPVPATPLWYDWKACLTQVDLFRELPRKELAKVAQLAEARFFRQDSNIVTAGSTSDGGALYSIVDGHVRVVTLSGHARDMGPGESFGELGLLDRSPRSATVTAYDDVKLACIKGPAFRRLLRTEPGVATGVLRSLVAIVRDLQVELGDGEEDAGTLRGGTQRLPDEFGEDWSLPKDEAVRLLASVPLFQALPKKHLRRIAGHVQLHTHPDGSVVVQKGSTRAWSFHVIVQGSARLTTAAGTSLLAPGEYFGELALIDGAPRAAEVVAKGTLTTLQISSTPFGRLLGDEPAVTLGLIQGLVRMIRDMQQVRGVS